MSCKFCGCTDRRPCMITVVDDPQDGTRSIVPAGIALVEADKEIRLVPCEWIGENVCSAPACVEKAYAEAALLADQLQFFIGRSA
jgi:hypothetical protein